MSPIQIDRFQRDLSAVKETWHLAVPNANGLFAKQEFFVIDILVVDDATVDRRVAAHVLQSIENCRVYTAADAETALECIANESIKLVLTDLNMPGLSGLELLDEIRFLELNIPVVLMSANGDERMAIEALRRGAANYILKSDLACELVDVCESVLAMSHEREQSEAVIDATVSGRIEFELGCDPNHASAIAKHLQAASSRALKCDAGTRTRIGVALEEALLNAVIHGNLEVPSDARELHVHDYKAVIASRQQEQPFGDRKVRVVYAWDEYSVCFAIEDEGPGFDVSSLPDPTDPANLLRASGRGVLLMNSFMDRVQFNACGNRVVMMKYKSVAEPATAGFESSEPRSKQPASPVDAAGPDQLRGPHAARDSSDRESCVVTD